MQQSKRDCMVIDSCFEVLVHLSSLRGSKK
jgi:hypothetical protein